MSFSDLRTRPYREFIDLNSDADALWFFLHIPKTAGSSFSSEIASARPPYRNVFVDETDSTVPYETKLQAAADNFATDAKMGLVRSASGHIPWSLVEGIRARAPKVRVVTILRDPITRVISDFRYQRTPAHPPYEQFIERFPTIIDYITAPESQDKMFKYLSGDSESKNIDAALAEIEKHITFIGLVEMYPMSFNTMMRLFGAGDRMPVEYKRRTENTEANHVDITPAVIKAITAVNRRDIALFNSVREILRDRREEWAALRLQET